MRRVIWLALLGVALVVLFQPELRGLLYRLRYPHTTRLLRRLPRTEVRDELLDAVDRLSRSGHGAIVVVEQEVSLDRYTRTGTELQANVSSDLLVTIFTPHTPLHDGAVIVRDVLVAAAGCILPLSRATFADRMIGTRHRAAVGLSEQTDALVVVVSEENATISVAYKGQLFRGLTTLELRAILGGEAPSETRSGMTTSGMADVRG